MLKEDREESVRILKMLIPKDSRGNGKVKTNIAVTEAILNAIEALKQEPKIEWIPVSERLPEDYKTVIASVDHECVFPEARYSKEFGWEWAYESGADYWEDLDGVNAWMPLPKPYSEVGQKE